MTQPGGGRRLAKRRVFTGRLLSVDEETIRTPAGTEVTLEMVRHPGAAAVVPLLSDPRSDDPHILLIHQYRYAAGGSIWEIPAGVLKPGEAPEACARRELEEETGARAERVEQLTTIYTTPGFTDERIHLFLATDITTGPAAPEQDELIEVQSRPISVILKMIRDGEIVDGKSVAALLFVAGFRLNL